MLWQDLVNQNIGLAVNIAKQFKPRNWSDFEDYRQQAILGLIKAAKKFSPDRGTKFTTYAGRSIYNTLERYVDKNRKYNKNHRRLNG